MRYVRFRYGWTMALVACLAAAATGLAAQEEGTRNGEWPSYGGDLAHTRYSPLDEINGDNFNDLEVAWSFNTDNFGPNPEFRLQSTPLMVIGVLYTTAGTRRAAVALDAATGEILWFHRYDEGERGAAAPRRLSGRGLTYLDDGGDGKIFYVTPGYHLIGLNAVTGKRLDDF
ncbi:MAG: PQQ-binding-like beta-propeller repeat protein, partial [Acidobacteria bacterium]|nr:PQQ-binding-like beta-propeller repeat protein [Acidobacteriota bacterium]